MPILWSGALAAGLSYYAAGRPNIQNQIDNSSIKTSSTKSGLEVLITTPNIGLYELETNEIAPGNLRVALNFYSTVSSGKIIVYESQLPLKSTTSGPASRRPTDYVKVKKLKKGTNIDVSVRDPKWGRAILNIYDDDAGKQKLKRIRLYDNRGRVVTDYRP